MAGAIRLMGAAESLVLGANRGATPTEEIPRKKVFAHFMTSCTAYPPFPPPPTEQRIASYKREIQLAQSKGIDGFVINTEVWDKNHQCYAEAMYQAELHLCTGDQVNKEDVPAGFHQQDTGLQFQLLHQLRDGGGIGRGRRAEAQSNLDEAGGRENIMMSNYCLGTMLTALPMMLVPASPGGAQRHIFNVRDYGAMPGSPNDAGGAIRDALAAAVATGPGSEVVLEAGTYRVAPPNHEGYCFPIHQAQGLTIRGVREATKLVVTDSTAGAFLLGLGRQIVLRDLTIDYDPVPFCQGTVRAGDMEGGCFDVEVDEGYPTPDAPNFVGAPEPYGKWGMILDRATRRIRTGTPDHYMTPRWEARGERIWRFFTVEEHYRRGLAHMRVGDAYVHLARGYGSAVLAQGCDGVRIEQVRVHASPGLAVGLVGNNGEVVVHGLEVCFPQDTTRLLTTNADGVHCQQNRAGPLIENCTFEGMADDAVNIYAPPNVVLEVRSPTEWRVSPGCLVLPNERLQVIDPQTGQRRGEVTAKDVKPEARSMVLTLAEPLEGVVSGADHRTGDTLYNLDACGAGFRIIGNTMRGHRRYGCMLRAGNGLVENNSFEDPTGAGVAILNEPDWPEGPVPWGITVRGNRFLRGGTCLGYADSPYGAALSVRAVRLGFSLAQGRPVRGMVFENNNFEDCLGAAIFAGACEGLTLRGNRITASPEAPLLRETGAIVLADSTGAVLTGNAVKDPRPGITAAVTIQAEVNAREAGVRIVDLEALLAPGSVPVDDQRMP